MAFPGEREKMRGVKCRFPIGLGQVFRDSPRFTHTYTYIPATTHAH